MSETHKHLPFLFKDKYNNFDYTIYKVVLSWILLYFVDSNEEGIWIALLPFNYEWCAWIFLFCFSAVAIYIVFFLIHAASQLKVGFCFGYLMVYCLFVFISMYNIADETTTLEYFTWFCEFHSDFFGAQNFLKFPLGTLYTLKSFMCVLLFSICFSMFFLFFAALVFIFSLRSSTYSCIFKVQTISFRSIPITLYYIETIFI